MWSTSAPSKREESERCTCLFQMTSNYDVSLSSFTQQQHNTGLILLFLCHSPTNRYSYILSHIVYDSYLDYRFRGDWSHDWEPRYYVLFYSCFEPVALADGSRTPIKGVGTVTTTLTLPRSFIFYLPHFFFNLLSVSKITKVLNCNDIFPTRVF